MTNDHQAQRTVAIIGGIFALLAAIIGGLFLLANTILDKTIPPVAPVTVVISQATSVTSMETPQSAIPPAASNSQTIFYIYYRDNGLTSEYKDWLTSEGYEFKAIDIAQVKTMDLSQAGLILVGSDTLGSGTAAMPYNAWGDDETVNAISNSGKPILGIGDGGYGIFGRLLLRIGGGFGAGGEGNGSVQLTPYLNILDEPNKITSGQTVLYTQTVPQREIYLGEDISPTPQESGVVEIGGMTYTNNGKSLKYGVVLMQNEKFVLWGFNASPSLLTDDGKHLFLNIVAHLLAK